MNYIVGEVVSPDYVPMMLQEININRTDTQELNNLKYCHSDLEVLIIGAGMSGILAGIRLAELGIKFKIYEKNINNRCPFKFRGNTGTEHASDFPR